MFDAQPAVSTAAECAEGQDGYGALGSYHSAPPTAALGLGTD
jgi:hypothetical protein